MPRRNKNAIERTGNPRRQEKRNANGRRRGAEHIDYRRRGLDPFRNPDSFR